MTTDSTTINEPASGKAVPYETDSEKYDAVSRCDRGADGRFVYAVITTGIYCRPSCKSKLAKRENVRFFPNNDAAGQAGFRPCKRCVPDEASIETQVSARMVAVCRMIEGAESAPALETLARSAGMSPFHFHREFKAVVGMTPKAYHKACRADRVREALRKSHNVSGAIYDAGYQSTGRFYADAGETLGMNPDSYRRGGVQETIHFAVGECSLGSVLVASTEKGVCAILMGDDANELAIDLQKRFAKATITDADETYEKVVATVIALIDSPALTASGLPLDIRGTVFQRKVWEALREIPPGKTVGYREIAEMIGSPKAVRAVAGACAANPLAVVIPCHRVVRTDGKLSGYRWGVERKRTLLEKESQG